MPTICICLSQDPQMTVFSFAPGEKINIHAVFEEENIPERYRLRILDSRQNSRLNRYGKGFTDLIVKDWPIPIRIRKEHLGIWQVWIEDLRGNVNPISQIFFVENTSRTERKLIYGPSILQIGSPVEELVPEPVIIEEPAVIEMVEEKITSGAIPVTVIKGVGKVTAAKLAELKIFTISDLLNYDDRGSLVKLLHFSEKKLETMIQNAEKISIYPSDQIIPTSKKKDLLNIKGIGPKSIQRLNSIGIKTKSDLINYKDLINLKKTLRMSENTIFKILHGIGLTETEIKIKKPVKKAGDLQDSVSELKGIGKVTTQKLNKIGIYTLKDLNESTYEQVKEITSKSTFLKWMKAISTYLQPQDKIKPIIKEKRAETVKKIHKSKSEENELLLIPGIGKKTYEKLLELEINSKKALLNFPEPEKARKALRMSLERFNKLIATLKKEIPSG
ncbi:helix-hairpin-helix domain-containing protein [Candidatus Hodarchaeum mangrovi]